jgi:erythromycin esterase-like protein
MDSGPISIELGLLVPSMPDPNRSSIIPALEQASSQLAGAVNDYDAFMDLVGSARFVLLGASTRGTHEFCAARARITRRLIEEKGFTAIALDADWTDVVRLNRYVHGSDGQHALASLDDFYHFPTWEWRNAAILDFVEWLRDYNLAHHQTAVMVGVHGLDLYNLHAASDLVINRLDEVDPAAARRLRHRCAYPCFDEFGADAQAYGYESSLGLTDRCEAELVNELVNQRVRLAHAAMNNREIVPLELFSAEQNPPLERSAGAYYRAMLGRRAEAWNARSRHLAGTLDALAQYLERSIGSGKVVVWAHTTHVGDGRATELGNRGELSLGQLIRDRHGRDALLVGLLTYNGTVTAASKWGGPIEQKVIPPAAPDSCETLFHEVTHPRLYLSLRQHTEVVSLLRQAQRQRALGAVYRPAIGPRNHYIHARLWEQFDAVVHFDQTTAVQPLPGDPDWQPHEQRAPLTASV